MWPGGCIQSQNFLNQALFSATSLWMGYHLGFSEKTKKKNY